MSVYGKLRLLPLRLLFQFHGALIVYSTTRLDAYPLFSRLFSLSSSKRAALVGPGVSSGYARAESEKFSVLGCEIMEFYS